MANNTGAAPLDPETPVGQFRLMSGDAKSVPLNPVVTGQGAYNHFSDDEITALLAASGSSVARAVGFGYLQLAAVYAMQGRSTKTDDLALSTVQRSGDLRAVAQSWFAQADAEDAAAVADIFEVAQYPGRSDTVVAGYPV